MSNLQEYQNAQITAFNGGHIVQIGGKTFYLTELERPSQLAQISSPRQIEQNPERRLIRLLWLAIAGLGGLLGLFLLREFFVVTPATAPVAQPQTVIVQPPQPEKKPYYYRECEPGGLFGWGQNCREERGWQ